MTMAEETTNAKNSDNTTHTNYPFGIRIAVVGSSSKTGKTTTLNALLHGDEYDGDSGANVLSAQQHKNTVICYQTSVVAGSKKLQRPILDLPVVSNVPYTLHQSDDDNEQKEDVTSTKTKIQELTLAVELSQPIFSSNKEASMRPDTTLSFIMIPNNSNEGSNNKDDEGGDDSENSGKENKKKKKKKTKGGDDDEKNPPSSEAFSITSTTTSNNVLFQTYLKQKWETLDGLLWILDAKKGWSGDDTEFAQHLQQAQEGKEIPIFVVLNKVDDKDDEKLQRHVKKMKTKLDKLLPNSVTHHVLPVSSRTAYVYRAAKSQTVYDFGDHFDPTLMDIIGKELLGKSAWKKLPDHEHKYRTLHTIINKQYDDGMHECGYDAFLQILHDTFGNEQQQTQILQQQIDWSLSKLQPFQSDWISYTIFSAFQKQTRLLEGTTTPPNDNNDDEQLVQDSQKSLRDAFWKTFEEYQNVTFDKFKTHFPRKVQVVSDPLQELEYYHKLVKMAKWEGEEEKILEKMEQLVGQYLRFVLRNNHETSNNAIWKWPMSSNCSPIDWSIIWRSMLLMSYEQTCCEKFGKELMLMQELFLDSMTWKQGGYAGFDKNCHFCGTKLDKTKKKQPRCKPCSIVYVPDASVFGSGTLECGYCGHGSVTKVGEDDDSYYQCDNCKYRHEALPNVSEWLQTKYDDDDGDDVNGSSDLLPVPVDPTNYQKIVHLEMVDKLSDPKHFGHPVYKFCEFAAACRRTNEKEAQNNNDKDNEKDPNSEKEHATATADANDAPASKGK